MIYLEPEKNKKKRSVPSSFARPCKHNHAMKRPREVEKKEQGRVEGQEGDDVLASKARKVSLFQITYEFASLRLTEKQVRIWFDLRS